jgi:hypothetical protein
LQDAAAASAGAASFEYPPETLQALTRAFPAHTILDGSNVTYASIPEWVQRLEANPSHLLVVLRRKSTSSIRVRGSGEGYVRWNDGVWLRGGATGFTSAIIFACERASTSFPQKHHDGLCAFVSIDLLHTLFHLLVVESPFRPHVLISLALAICVMRMATPRCWVT